MKPWDFYTTTDRILRTLIENDGKPPHELFAAVQADIPDVSHAEFESAVYNLSSDGLVSVQPGDDEILYISVNPRARAYLMDKRDVKVFILKWDLLKIAFGYGLGFISGWLLQ